MSTRTLASLGIDQGIPAVQTARGRGAVDKGSGVVYTAPERTPVEFSHCRLLALWRPQSVAPRGQPLDPIVAATPRAVINEVDVAYDLE